MANVSLSGIAVGVDDSFDISDDNFQDPCAICREPFTSLNGPFTTNCKHEYHFLCIDKWFRIKKKCPTCRQYLLSFREKNAVEEENTIPNLLIFHGINTSDEFEITHPIGKSNNGMVRVYKAISCCNSLQENVYVAHVAVKCISSNENNQQAMSYLTRDVQRSLSIPYHRNIVGIIKEFYYKSYYCVVFPQYYSLRSIMHARFPNGFPEKCIVVVLKEILNALSLIHTESCSHSEINAGNIFFTRNEIKLAFSASTYECAKDNEYRPPPSFSTSSWPSYLPMGSICKWAVPPEYYHPYSKINPRKVDVWMIGLTALELSYGALWVSDRRHLIEKLSGIVGNRALPGSWIEKKVRGIKMLIKWYIPFNKERYFSRPFEKMVAKCLSWNPAERPTIEELQGYDVFKKCNKDINYFSRVVGG